MAPESVLDGLLSAVRTFSQGAPQADDITALVLKYLDSSGTPEPEPLNPELNP